MSHGAEEYLKTAKTARQRGKWPETGAALGFGAPRYLRGNHAAHAARIMSFWA
jgi:hypothetical protein